MDLGALTCSSFFYVFDERSELVRPLLLGTLKRSSAPLILIYWSEQAVIL